MRPTKTIGSEDMIREADPLRLGSLVPKINSAAPTHGSNAAAPGKGVSALKTKQASRIMPRPKRAKTSAALVASRTALGRGRRAKIEPNNSYQALPGNR